MNGRAATRVNRSGATIAVDVMSGDRGVAEILPSIPWFLRRHPETRLLLVGDQERIRGLLGAQCDDARLEICHSTEVIAMDEPPAHALRGKPNASLRVAVDLVKEKRADACVSAGNTGALMAIAWYVLRMLPGVSRPAICAEMPGLRQSTHILDLGANLDPSPEQLLQFAIMGSELVSAVENKPAPRVALLNVGTEETKGNKRIKRSTELLKASSLNYVGYAEGEHFFSGDFDVIVCDGFSGNVALKSSEGAARLILGLARDTFGKSLYGRLAAAFARPVLRQMKQVIDPANYNGATLLGLRGIVVKSHGNAGSLSFGRALEEALMEVEKNVPGRILSRVDTGASGRGKTEEHVD